MAANKKELVEKTARQENLESVKGKKWDPGKRNKFSGTSL